MRKAIIVDLDGTLSNSELRVKLCTDDKGKLDFIKFYESLGTDMPNYWCRDIIKTYEGSIILVSGRPHKYRAKTIEWLNFHNIKFLRLMMRVDEDYRKDSIIKKEIYEYFIKDSFDIEYCIDDRQQVVDMWRDLGLTCLQCAKGDF